MILRSARRVTRVNMVYTRPKVNAAVMSTITVVRMVAPCALCPVMACANASGNVRFRWTAPPPQDLGLYFAARDVHRLWHAWKCNADLVRVAMFIKMHGLHRADASIHNIVLHAFIHQQHDLHASTHAGQGVEAWIWGQEALCLLPVRARAQGLHVQRWGDNRPHIMHMAAAADGATGTERRPSNCKALHCNCVPLYHLHVAGAEITTPNCQ